MSAGTYAAAAAALGVGLEATGTTAVTPLGQQAREQGRRGPSVPQVPDSGADIGDVLAAVQAAQQGAERGDVNVDLSGLAQQGQQAGGLPAAATELMEQYRRQAEEARERAEEARSRAEDAAGGDVDGGGESDLSLPEWLTDRPGQGGEPEPDQGSDPDDFRLQDLDGRGPFGIGTGLAAGGEIGAATGETVEKSVGGLTKVGNTYSQVARAVAGKEYSAEDTLAEGIHGTETRRIDWDDYNPLSGGDAGGDAGGGGGGGGSSDGPSLEDMTASVTGGLSNNLPGVEGDQDYDSGSDAGDDEEPAPLPEELRRRLGGPTDLPAGGL